jgi:hypothetical protein
MTPITASTKTETINVHGENHSLPLAPPAVDSA